MKRNELKEGLILVNPKTKTRIKLFKRSSPRIWDIEQLRPMKRFPLSPCGEKFLLENFEIVENTYRPISNNNLLNQVL